MGGMKNTCTDKGIFGRYLMGLGKQSANGVRATTELEETMIGKRNRSWLNASEIPVTPNDVFFFDMAQLADENETRNLAFRKDIQEFLGLQEELPKLVHAKPGRKWDATVQAEKDKRKIDICVMSISLSETSSCAWAA
jgi:hypothetical protein